MELRELAYLKSSHFKVLYLNIRYYICLSFLKLQLNEPINTAKTVPAKSPPCKWSNSSIIMLIKTPDIAEFRLASTFPCLVKACFLEPAIIPPCSCSKHTELRSTLFFLMLKVNEFLCCSKLIYSHNEGTLLIFHFKNV